MWKHLVLWVDPPCELQKMWPARQHLPATSFRAIRLFISVRTNHRKISSKLTPTAMFPSQKVTWFLISFRQNLSSNCSNYLVFLEHVCIARKKFCVFAQKNKNVTRFHFGPEVISWCTLDASSTASSIFRCPPVSLFLTTCTLPSVMYTRSLPFILGKKTISPGTRHHRTL